LLNDDFNDGVVSTQWTYKKTWTESGGLLTATATNKKASAVATPVFSAGCQTCGISTSLTASAGATVSVYGWYATAKNYVEVQFKEANDKVQILQKSGGNTVAKQSAALTIDPGTAYTVTITYNGTNVVVNVDGTDVITFAPSGSLPTGTAGFVVKNGTGSFDYIIVN
jgi:hypothetical protein